MMICLLSNSNNSYGVSFWLITIIFSPVFQLKENNTPLEFDGDLIGMEVGKVKTKKKSTRMDVVPVSNSSASLLKT